MGSPLVARPATRIHLMATPRRPGRVAVNPVRSCGGGPVAPTARPGSCVTCTRSVVRSGDSDPMLHLGVCAAPAGILPVVRREGSAEPQDLTWVDAGGVGANAAVGLVNGLPPSVTPC